MKPQKELIDKLTDSYIEHPKKSLLTQDVFTAFLNILSEYSSFFDQSGSHVKSKKNFITEINKKVGFRINIDDPFKMGESFSTEKINRLYDYLSPLRKMKDSTKFEYVTIILKYHFPAWCKTATPDKVKNRCYRQTGSKSR